MEGALEGCEARDVERSGEDCVWPGVQHHLPWPPQRVGSSTLGLSTMLRVTVLRVTVVVQDRTAEDGRSTKVLEYCRVRREWFVGSLHYSVRTASTTVIGAQ